MNQVKKQPATPLPWKLAGDHESIELLGADGDCINSAARASYGDDYKRVATDMNYERHAANAYPKLIEALRNARASFVSAYLKGAEIRNGGRIGSPKRIAGEAMQHYAQSGQDDVDAILRDLGESE